MRAVLIDKDARIIGEVHSGGSRTRLIELEPRSFVIASLGLLTDDQFALFQEVEPLKLTALDKEFK